jgi:hypothetical protein
MIYLFNIKKALLHHLSVKQAERLLKTGGSVKIWTQQPQWLLPWS